MKLSPWRTAFAFIFPFDAPHLVHPVIKFLLFQKLSLHKDLSFFAEADFLKNACLKQSYTNVVFL